jgi:Na+/H+-translocating membrane pyrophosphatase
VFAGLLVGAMLPFWFSAMTMKSVGKAALAMVQEVGARAHARTCGYVRKPIAKSVQA